jgi:hypothetical protein
MNEIGKLHTPFKAYLAKVGLPYDYSQPHRRTRNTPGQPDFSIYKNNRVLLIEFKEPGNKLSQDQIDRINELQATGNGVHICYDLQGAVDLTDRWRNSFTLARHRSRNALQPDHEPEQKWGTQHDVREHLRFGGQLEDYDADI